MSTEENMLNAMRSRGNYTKVDVEALCGIAVAAALKGVEMQVQRRECPRIELVGALYELASHFENSLYAFRDDAEALLKAKRDIAWARKTAARHNQNGPGCGPNGSAKPHSAAQKEKP
jgi:hypothetical protein